MSKFESLSRLGLLKNLGKIITKLNLKKFTKDLSKVEDAATWLKENNNPILNFIGNETPLGKNFNNYATLITSSVLIVDNALDVLTDESLSASGRKSKVKLIVSDLGKMTGATDKFNDSQKQKNFWLLSIFSAGISLAANLLADNNDVTSADKKKINKSYAEFSESVGSDIDTKNFAQVLYFASSVLNAVDEYNARKEKYIEDDIPEEIAKHDAFIDALAVFVHDNATAYTLGFDDWAFEFILGLADKETDKNYVEIIGDQFKILNGTSGDDSIISIKNKSYIYGDSGNDSITNIASNVSIWGGHDNDTIWSIKTENLTPARNSVFGGTGNDLIFIQDKLSTIHGGRGDDSIVIDSAAQKNNFYYATGDGLDSIYGFKANDSLTISGKFSTVKSGSDIKVQVGDGSIILLGAADKKININGKVYNKTPSGSVTLTPIELPDLPESPIVNGTADSDFIKNYRSNVLIKAGAGNDSLYNNGSNVSIDAGTGNDTIYSDDWANNISIGAGDGNDSIISLLTGFVTLSGGKGNDTVYSNGHDVQIFGGDGNDSIVNAESGNVTINAGTGNDIVWNSSWNEKVTVSGGAGNDSIRNDSGSKVLIKYDSGDGNDTVLGFDSDDTLQIGGGLGSYYSKTSGSDIIVTVGKGKITLQGAASLETLNIDGVYKDPTLLTVTNSTKSPLTIDSAIKTVNASARTKAINITGNKSANLIIGGSKADTLYGAAGNDSLYGGAGNDCILGGKGNDSLWGDAGADKFIYASGDGKDVIFGFDNKDTLTFDNLDFKASYKNEAVVFNVSGGSVTLKDFTATTFHVNGDTYKISDTKLIRN